MQFPTVKGSNLKRQKMVFPNDFAGDINLVFTVFLRRHQDLIDEWVPFVEDLVNEHPEIQHYEFPTLPRRDPIYRTFLNEGMRAGIPSDATAHARSRSFWTNARSDKRSALKTRQICGFICLTIRAKCCGALPEDSPRERVQPCAMP